MTLVELDLPSPARLRGGWAAFAAVCAARGWSDSAHATPDRWYFHDGGGNWARLLFKGEGRAVLVGHDHEYSRTYFRESAAYFQEEETDLLAGAPAWWDGDLTTGPDEWIGFVYGWDGRHWRRAAYDLDDGFGGVGLLRACGLDGTDHLGEFAREAPGLEGRAPDPKALEALAGADAHVTRALLEAAVPNWDIDAGVAAARAFLAAEVEA